MNAIHHPKGRKGHVTSGEFTRAMGAAATGVTVVTTEGVAGRYGLTVSAIASVSAEPPLLLVCVNRRNPCVAAMTQNGRFAVNILSETQEDVARIFSGKPVSGEAYDFTRHGWELGEHGMPLLTDAAAHFECEVDTIHDAGTHRIFIGRVIAALRGETPPLLYSNRSYGRLSPLDEGPE
ncbi:flavin reductase family protein [Aestuariivirga sp.]|uniref:flavin reductase family protein n=1 Tax=Aestuariivirga sp. TaxID=2650926 RepID=UPI0039E559DC